MKKIIQTILVLAITNIIMSCGTFQKAVEIDSNTNYFPAKKNKIVNVIKDKPLENSLNKATLLVVNEEEYFENMGNNLSFFDSVLTYNNFDIAINKKESSDNTHSIKMPFVKSFSFFSLEIVKTKKEKNGWFAGLKLYDHQNKKVIFKNEIKLNLMWDGWTDQGTMFPLYNSLLDYLRKQ